MTVTLSTLPDATAWALTEQIDDSRQPLPTPPPLAKPMWYGPAAALGAVDAPLLEQAAATIATTARPPSALARIDPFWIMRTPPLRTGRPSWPSRGSNVSSPPADGGYMRIM